MDFERGRAAGRVLAAVRGFDARSGSKDLIYVGWRLRECFDQVAEELAKPGPAMRGLRFKNSPERQIEQA